MSVAVTVKNLTKTYGTFPAVKGIDFEIESGEVFGLLGPNGEGKATGIKVVIGGISGRNRPMSHDAEARRGRGDQP